MQDDKQIHFRVAVNANSFVHVCCIEPRASKNKSELIIFSHGFSVDGTESRRMFLSIARMLCAQGYTCILFDYRGSGYSDFEFEDMTFDTELADLHAVIEFSKQKFKDCKIGIWAMSFGCALAAQAVSERSDVSFLVLWCLSAEVYRRYRERLGKSIEELGYTYIDKGYRVEKKFLDSLKERDTYIAIKAIKAPILLVHGDADAVASVELSRKAHAFAPDHTTLCEISGGKHGFKLQPTQYQKAIEATLQWILKNASNSSRKTPSS